MAQSKHTRGPWFVSGVRFKMNGGEWHSVSRYDEAKKQDENIACVGYDPRTGAGLSDARLIAAAPELLEQLRIVTDDLEKVLRARGFRDDPKVLAARAAIARVEGGAS